MARKRMIDPGIWQSEDFSKLSYLERLVFIGLFSNADDEGRGRAKASYVKSMIFPYDDEMKVDEVDKMLSEIAAVMSVTFYVCNGNEYYCLDKWSQWQKIDRPGKSTLPPPDDCSVIIRRRIDESSTNHRLRVAPNRIEDNRKENKNTLSSQPPPAAEDGERILTASEINNPSERNNEIGRAADAQTEVLDVHADDSGSGNKQSKKKRKHDYEHDNKYYIAAKWLADRIESRIPSYRKHSESTLQEWADSARLIFEVDKRDPELANKLLPFSQNDEFWAKNILSMTKFRKQFDNLLARYQSLQNSQGGAAKTKVSPFNTGYINLTEMVARGES